MLIIYYITPMMVTLQEKEELTLVWHPPENATGTVRFL